MQRLSFLLVALVACGGTQDGSTTPTGPGSGSNGPAAAGDVSIEIPATKLEGVLFEPEALGRPGMPIVNAKKQLSLANQRKKYEVTKDPLVKEAEAAILATMLFQESKTKTGDE